MSEIRIIKKYPNRRLYDTAVSSYVTLESVRQLVLDREEFQVRDARTEEDITRSILLQIIFEQEEDGTPIFSTDILRKFIQFYGHDLQNVMTQYLEQSVAVFIEQQEQFKHNFEKVLTQAPSNWLADLTKQNLDLWRSWHDGFKPPTGRDAEEMPVKTTKTPSTEEARAETKD